MYGVAIICVRKGCVCVGERESLGSPGSRTQNGIRSAKDLLRRTILEEEEGKSRREKALRALPAEAHWRRGG